MNINRRDCLTAGSALLAAGALAAPNEALAARGGGGNRVSDVLYGHGMVWNRALPGVAGQLNLSFDLRANLETGTGGGSAHDPVHPEWNLHFDIRYVERQRQPKGETLYTMAGFVTEANDPALVGQPVKTLAQTVGDTTAIAIAIGELSFGGAGLVVIDLTRVIMELLVHIIMRS